MPHKTTQRASSKFRIDKKQAIAGPGNKDRVIQKCQQNTLTLSHVAKTLLIFNVT